MASIDLSGLKRANPQVTVDDQEPLVPVADQYTYKDIKLDLEFGKDTGNFPETRSTNNTDLREATDLEDLRQSLDNILNTIPGQKILNPYFGLNLSNFLFQPVTEQTANHIARTLRLGLPAQDSRLATTSIRVMGDQEKGTYDITLGIKYVGRLNDIIVTGTFSQDGFTVTQ